MESSDCHAGANHATYREYLTKAQQEEFDAWRGGYKNPFRDLQDYVARTSGREAYQRAMEICHATKAWAAEASGWRNALPNGA